MHIAPPCASFSRAQSRSGRAIRSAEKPWGLDNLTGSENARIAEGNQCAVTVLRILALCVQFNVPAAVEQPRTSYFWKIPEIKQYIERGRLVSYHMCAFVAKWEKSQAIYFYSSTVDVPYTGRYGNQKRRQGTGTNFKVHCIARTMPSLSFNASVHSLAKDW